MLTVFAVGVSVDTKTLTHIHAKEGADSRSISIEATELLENLANFLLSANSRKTIDGTMGKWLTLRKSKASFFALVSSSYPERVGYKALEDTSNFFNSSSSSGDIEAFLEELIGKYNSPENFDKLTAVNAKVDDLKADVQGNLNRLVMNDDNLNELDENAKKLHDEAHMFSKNSKSLKRVLWWRNVWFWVMVIGVAVGVIVLIVLLLKLT